MIYFLSDAHLGSRVITSPHDHISKLVDLLNQMAKDATHIFLLGDIFDFWYEYIWERSYWQKKDGSWTLPKNKKLYAPLIQTLHSLTQSGIEIHFFIGNHDIWTFGNLQRNTGVIIHRHPESFTLNGKKVYMAHGDGVVPLDYMQSLPPQWQKKIRRFMRLRAFFHHPVPQFLFRLMPPFMGDAFGYEWARRSRLKEIGNPCPFKGEEKEELVLFAKEQETVLLDNHHDYYIFGHRHIVLDLDIKSDLKEEKLLLPSSRVIILGDFFQQFTYAQMDDSGKVSIIYQLSNYHEFPPTTT